MSYNDDYQQRQREDDCRRRDEEDRRRRDEEERRRRDEEERRRRDEEERRRRDEEERRRRDEEERRRRDEEDRRRLEEEKRKRDDERQAQIKRDLDAAAEARKGELERIAGQLKEDLDKNATQLKIDLNARSEKEREWNKAMERKIALERSELILQQMSHRHEPLADTTSSMPASVPGVLCDSMSIAAALMAMIEPNFNENSSFLDSNGIARKFSELSISDIKGMAAEIKLQKKNNVADLAAEAAAREFSVHNLPEKKLKKSTRASILDERWNRDIGIKSEKNLQSEKNVIIKIPDMKWIASIGEKTSNLSVEDWKYPVKLSDKTIFGPGNFAATNWKIINQNYYSELISVIELQGANYVVKDNVRAILKIHPVITEAELIDPEVAVQRTPISMDVINLLRHEDLIGFNLRNNSCSPLANEATLKKMLDDGYIYSFTYMCCHKIAGETMMQAKIVGLTLGRTVLQHIDNLVDGKDWKHHWEIKYGRPPSRNEEIRILGCDQLILTDDDIETKERAEKEAIWNGLSFWQKAKRISIDRFKIPLNSK